MRMQKTLPATNMWQRPLQIVGPAVLIGSVLATTVAYSQPPESNPVSAPSSESATPVPTSTPTPVPVKQSAPTSDTTQSFQAQQAPAPYTGTVTIFTPLRREDIAQPSVPLGTDDFLHRRVFVDFSAPVPTGATVQFVVFNAGQANGDARVVENATRRTDGTISLEGVAQTEPGSGGNLKVVCLVNDENVGESEGFSVCAHPNGIHYKFIRNVIGEVQPLTNQLAWAAGYGSLFGVIESDSGNGNDLDAISINEDITVTESTGLFQGRNPVVGRFTNISQEGGIADLVGATDDTATDLQQSIAAFPTSRLVASQVHRFACPRCNIPASANAPKVSKSGFRNYVTASKSTTGADRYYIRARKSAYDNGGVSRGTVDNNTTQLIEVKEAGAP